MQLSRHIIAKVRTLLSDHSGFQLPDWVVVARVSERARALGIERPDRYVDLLSTDEGHAELNTLVESLRVGETSFYRHRAQMDAVRDLVAPAIAEEGRTKVRVWSAGCASGEEPYSVAMVLREALPAAIEISVLASDMSAEAIEAAKRRTYPTTALARIPSVVRNRYFEVEGDQHRVTDALAKLVRFERRNLADGGFPGGFDLVLCRNVLIYFSADARRSVVEGLIGSLRYGGYLAVGYSETLRSYSQLVSARSQDAVIYQRTRRAAAVPDRQKPASTPPPTAEPSPVPQRPSRKTRIALSGRYEDGDERLAAELSRALGGGHKRVVIAVDGAEYLGDEAGTVLRRALSAAAADGVEVLVHAERPGTQRWLRRLGIGIEGSP